MTLVGYPVIYSVLMQAPVIPSGPAWAVAIVIFIGGVVLIIREIGQLLVVEFQRRRITIPDLGIRPGLLGANGHDQLECHQ